MHIKKRISGLLATVMVLAGMAIVAPNASAETVSMRWKEMDKAYISIIIDDNNSELQQMYDLITGEYGFPLCVAVPVKSYDKTLNYTALPDSLELLHEIENHGGEILSHTLTHKVFNREVDWDTVDYELGESYRRLTAEGFNVNGVILAGGGGSEDTTEEYRTELEAYTSKYYQYSDLYGASTQYYHPRKWMYSGYDECKYTIDTAIANKTWEVLAGHGISKEIFPQTEEKVRQILEYLKQKQDEGVLEVVTYKEAHEKYAEWDGDVDFGDTKYTVDFYSTDNETLLTSVAVTEGQTATAPEIEVAGGVTFKGWSDAIDNITANTRVYAKCIYANGEMVQLTDAAAVRLKPTATTTTTTTTATVTTTTTVKPSSTTATSTTTAKPTSSTVTTTTTTTATRTPTVTTTTTTISNTNEPSAPESEPIEDEPTDTPTVSDNDAQPPVKKTRALPFILLGACAVIAAGVAGVLIWNKKKTPPTE